MVRNERMRESFLKISQSVCEFLLGRYKAGAPLLTISRKEAHWESYGPIVQSKPEYNLIEFVQRYMSAIHKFPETEECIDVMKADPVVAEHLENRIGAFTSCSLFQTQSVFRTFFTHLMTEMKNLEFKFDSFEKTYMMMEDFFYGSTIEAEVFAHLEGFVSTADYLDLGDGWEISKIPNERYNDLLTNDLLGDDMHTNTSRHALSWHVHAKKIILKNNEKFESPKEYQECQKTARDILTALRIFKSGDIGIRRIIRFYKAWSSEIRGVSTSYIKPFWGQPYSLQDSEVSNFRNLLDILRRIELDSPLTLAIKRLNDAVERQDAYDSLLDYIISFEALFLHRKEKKWKLRYRVARIISNEEIEQKRIAKDMKNAYDLRSSIAHGDTESQIREVLQRTGYSKREFAEIVGNYLRQSIRKYLAQLSKGLDKKRILEGLER